MNQDALNPIEKKAALSLAGVFGLRMIGLFMILPIFAVYGAELEGFNGLWLGLAIGAYGFTQALLQIPMGILSDKFGRKPIIYAGLVMFCIGSIVAAMSESVYGVVIGRALQGMGAIASAVLALAADLSREEQRPKVMATIGMFIGVSFALAMVLGPVVADAFALSGVFWLTAILALGGMLVIKYIVPDAINVAPKGDSVAVPAKLKMMLVNPQLMRLNVGVFSLHLALTAMFVALPAMLVDLGFAANRHWQLYLPALLVAFVLMVPFMIWAIKKNKEKLVFCAAVLLLIACALALWVYQQSFIALVVTVVLFFVAFNYLEATMPSTLSRIAPAGDKGSAMGIFSTSQFFGAFVGGLAGGVVQMNYSQAGVFLFAALILVVWLLLALTMKMPAKAKSVSLKLNFSDEDHAKEVAQKIMTMPGVIESTIVYSESVAYLKIDEKLADLTSIKAQFS
ncbi:MFS transporter [Thalassotalea litorea]|uniref:MFS transporter n=1 Tax=Thalassotalea litorea TaxID=2020715 RepID=UPI003735009E